MFQVLALLVALALLEFARGRTQICPQAESGNLCYSVSLPDATVSSGSGDVYFQIQGPASKQWIALGQGGRMAGANIFVIYADSNGSNVTLSPSPGQGHVQPRYDQGIQAFLLEGSGIANGKMTANVRCTSCIKWQGSTLDVTSTQSTWIWAARDGAPVSSDSPSANLEQHDSNGQLIFDLTKARTGNSLNPFVNQAAATTASGNLASTTATSSGSSDSGNEDGSSSPTSGSTQGSNTSGSGESQEGIPSAKRRNILIAHGVIMSLAWVIFFPLGAIIIRTISSRNVIHVHSLTQSFAYTLALVGMALGIYVATNPYNMINVYHPIIGLVVVGLATVQPILGTIHHRIYKVHGQRTAWATTHIVLGRLVITLAIINGGLGLRMAGNSRKGEIAYGVVAGIVWLVWMAVAVRSWVNRDKARKPMGDNQTPTRKRIYG